MQGEAAPVVPLRAAHVDEWRVDGELVLYDLQSERIHVCNGTAAFIWRLCDGEHAASEIIAALSEYFPESQPAIAMDVVATLERFQAERLLAS